MIFNSVVNYCKAYISLVKIIVCMVFASVLLNLSYRWTNNSLVGVENESLVLNLNIFLNDVFGIESSDEDAIDGVVFINISNDKELIDVTDAFGIPKGNTAITDRQKLIALIDAMQGKQKVAFFDIFFDPSFESAHDSVLNSRLSASENIIIPSIIRGDSVIAPKFDGLVGVSSYDKTLFSNKFVKYTYLHYDSIPSVALLMHHIINNKTVVKKGSYYYSDTNLCLNSLIIDHRIKSIHKYEDDLTYTYSELGEDILGAMTKEEIQSMVAEKIVLVGDYDDVDIHQTIFGPIPGVVINYNSFLSLDEGRHLIKTSEIVFLFMAYFLIALFILFDIDISFKQHIYKKFATFKLFKRLKFKSLIFDNIVIEIVKSFVQIGILISGLSLLFYYLYGQYIEILGTTIVFGTVLIVRTFYTKNYVN